MSVDNLRFAPPDDWTDPRSELGFEPAHFPQCDGGEPPLVGAADLNDRRKLEFLGAYYAINRAYARLEAVADAERRDALLSLNTALTARDHLEDRYAPIGFYGEPRLEGERTADVHFMHAPENPPASGPISSGEFAITPPVVIPDDAPRRVLDFADFLRVTEEEFGKAAGDNGKADP